MDGIEPPTYWLLKLTAKCSKPLSYTLNNETHKK